MRALTAFGFVVTLIPFVAFSVYAQEYSSDYAFQVTPTPEILTTPTPTGIPNAFSTPHFEPWSTEERAAKEKEKKKIELQIELEKMKEMMRQNQAVRGVQNYDIPIDEIEIEEPEELTAHQAKKKYGKFLDLYEVPPDKRLNDCLYTPGYRDPSICVDDNNKVFYRRGDGEAKLQELMRKQGKLK